MSNPYEVLGIPDNADDAAIRRRYLELIRQFSPEHHPEKFTAIRAAYENLKDLNTRVTHRLFETGRHETVTAIVEELECRSPRRRLSLQKLLSLLRK